MAVVRPQMLADGRDTGAAIELLFPRPRLAAFAIATGVDLREVSVALAAGFDYSTLYAIERAEASDVVEQRFVDRLVGQARVVSSHPAISRISGTIEGVPETLVHVRGRLVAVAVGDPTPVRVVELFAERRLPRSPAALHGAALSTLPGDLARAPLVFYAPGPFTGEWAAGARGLLGAAVALGASATPEGAALRLRVVVTGRFGTADGDRLAAAWTDLEESSVGRLLALDHPLEPAKAVASADQLLLEVTLGLMPLASGLRAAVAADVWEILNIPPPPAKGAGSPG